MSNSPTTRNFLAEGDWANVLCSPLKDRNRGVVRRLLQPFMLHRELEEDREVCM